MSSDGRYVAFSSHASNLVPDDTNGTMDVFLWDRTTGTTTRITDGNSFSRSPSLSADGRYVTFDSDASNLVADDTNGFTDVFRWDRVTQTTTRITEGDDASGRPVISADGRFVAFDSRALSFSDETWGYDRDVFVWDAVTGTTTRITPDVQVLDEDSFSSGISADGRYVTISSVTPFDPGDTNERSDVYLWDAVTGSITHISDDGAASGGSVSHDGRFVAYDAQGLAQVFVWDSTTGTSTRLTESVDVANHAPKISGSGRYISFLTGYNAIWNVVRYDRETASITEVTHGDGWASGSAISSDGEVIAFATTAEDLVADDTNGVEDIFLWEHSS